MDGIKKWYGRSVDDVRSPAKNLTTAITLERSVPGGPGIEREIYVGTYMYVVVPSTGTNGLCMAVLSTITVRSTRSNIRTSHSRK